MNSEKNNGERYSPSRCCQEYGKKAIDVDRRRQKIDQINSHQGLKTAILGIAAAAILAGTIAWNANTQKNIFMAGQAENITESTVLQSYQVGPEDVQYSTDGTMKIQLDDNAYCELECDLFFDKNGNLRNSSVGVCAGSATQKISDKQTIHTSFEIDEEHINYKDGISIDEALNYLGIEAKNIN